MVYYRSCLLGLYVAAFQLVYCRGFVAISPVCRPCNGFQQLKNKAPRTRNESPQYPGSSNKDRNDSVVVLQLATADYSDAARVLFSNVITPAAMISGTIVPLGFLGPPMPRDTRWKKKMDCIFNILTVISLGNELLAIMYATVANNMLVRAHPEPAVSVFALIKRDYELAWIACFVHFMLGLCGFIGMVTTRALSFYPSSLNIAAAGFGLASLLGMFSVGNHGVNIGDGRGNSYGQNFVVFILRYIVLVAAHIRQNRSVIGALSIVLGMLSTALTIRNLVKPESEE